MVTRLEADEDGGADVPRLAEKHYPQITQISQIQGSLTLHFMANLRNPCNLRIVFLVPRRPKFRLLSRSFLPVCGRQVHLVAEEIQQQQSADSTAALAAT